MEAGAEALRHLLETTPIIDNHAHPLLNESHVDAHPLLSIASEAHGDALNASRTGLPHLRAVKQLAGRLGCEETWEAVEGAIKHRRKTDYAGWTRECLSGIECVLVDDGLDGEDAVESYRHFNQFSPSPSKRIVRIEHVVARLIDAACLQHGTPSEAFRATMSGFQDMLHNAIADPEVVGFKSVICYRSGLAVAAQPSLNDALPAFASIYSRRREPGATSFTRLNDRILNELYVHIAAQFIRDSDATHMKPFQFHTGLGDNDLTLTRSSPAHLQDFVRTYPTVPIVLLHSGYPFDREMGYMAAMYSNVYADIGEVFPFVSRGGQESILRHMLEVCPWEKIIWSTDGHWFPETFFLSIVQMREVFHSVLCDFVQRGDLSWEQASQLVQDVLFNTSNKLYDLGLARIAPEPLQTLALRDSPPAVQEGPRQRLLSALNLGNVQFVRICWVDYTGTLRVKLFPLRQAKSIIAANDTLVATLPKACLGQMQDDTIVSDVGPAGQYKLHADLSSLRPGPRDGQLTLMCEYREQDGSEASLCPRSLLRKAVRRAEELDIKLKFGFEIELVITRPSPNGDYGLQDADGHAYSSVRAMQHEVVEKVLEPAIHILEKAGIYVEMLHAESAKGQFEIVLPPADPVDGVDILVFTREVVLSCASRHGYRMTLHPKPLSDACGTAAHTHMSVASCRDGSSNKTVWESFYAGVLTHLRAICAFTYSNMVSYDRVQDGTWAGGTWVAWGTQNREVPLRKVRDGHWEIRCVDGLANPYLAMMAIVVAGLSGVTRQEKMAWGDCTKDPGSLFWEERLNLGINSNLPASIQEALESLSKDEVMVEAVGEDVVRRYLAVKTAETKKLQALGPDARKKWIMDRY